MIRRVLSVDGKAILAYPCCQRLTAVESFQLIRTRVHLHTTSHVDDTAHVTLLQKQCYPSHFGSSVFAAFSENEKVNSHVMPRASMLVNNAIIPTLVSDPITRKVYFLTSVRLIYAHHINRASSHINLKGSSLMA